jgi:hypothetical protein
MGKPLIVLCWIFLLCGQSQWGDTKQTRPLRSRDPFNPPSIRSKKIITLDTIIVHGIVTVDQQCAAVVTVEDETETLCKGQSFHGCRVHSITKNDVVLEYNKQLKKYNFVDK